MYVFVPLYAYEYVYLYEAGCDGTSPAIPRNISLAPPQPPFRHDEFLRLANPRVLERRIRSTFPLFTGLQPQHEGNEFSRFEDARSS